MKNQYGFVFSKYVIAILILGAIVLILAPKIYPMIDSIYRVAADSHTDAMQVRLFGRQSAGLGQGLTCTEAYNQAFAGLQADIKKDNKIADWQIIQTPKQGETILFAVTNWNNIESGRKLLTAAEVCSAK